MNIHHLKGHIQSIYLIEYPNQLLLLDGCCRADINLLIAFITTTLQRPLSDLSLIVVTHMHPDHAGAANKLRKITGCKIASANQPEQWYKGLKGRFSHIVDIGLAIWVASRMGKPFKNLWYSPYLSPDYKLNDQDKLPGFSDWSVLTMPGHTDRDLSVWHSSTQCIYVADLLVNVKSRFIPPIPVNFPKHYFASISKLKSLAPRSIMLAHGGQVTLTENDYQHLLTIVSKHPVTIWTPAKNKLKRLLIRKKG